VILQEVDPNLVINGLVSTNSPTYFLVSVCHFSANCQSCLERKEKTIHGGLESYLHRNTSTVSAWLFRRERVGRASKKSLLQEEPGF